MFGTLIGGNHMIEIEARKALTRVPSGMAAQMLGVCTKTLRNWHERGLIDAERTRAGRFLWNVSAYLEREGRATEDATAGTGTDPMPAAAI